jgi:hypothetical protein
MKRTQFAIGGIAAIVVAAGAVYGLDLYANYEAAQQVDATFSHLPAGMQGKHGRVSYSILGDRLAVADVALDAPGQWLTSFSAARLDVTGINHGLFGMLLSRGWGRGDGGWSAGSIVADTVGYAIAGGGRQSIERIVVDDPRLDTGDGTPMEQWTLARWIAALSLSSGEATNLRAMADQQPSGIEATMAVASRRFSDFKGGHLAGVADKGVVWDMTSPPSVKVHAEAREVYANDIDFLGGEKIFNPANYRDGQRDATLYTLCGDAGASGLAALVERSGSALAVALDGVSLSGIKMRQLPFAPGVPAIEPTPEQSVALLKSFALDGMAIDKLSVTNPSASFVLGRFAMKLGENGRIDHAEIADLAVTAPDASFALGSFALDGFAWRLPEGLLRLDPKDWAAAAPGVPPPRVFIERYRLADIAFQHKAVGEISLKDLTATMTGDIDRPTGGTVEMQRLGVDFAAIAANPSARMLRGLGYGQVFFEAHGSATYDTDAKIFELSRLSFGAPEMGMLSLAYRVGNYPADLPWADQGATFRRLMDLAVERVELRYDDASLAERLLAVWAAGTNQSPAATREGLLTALEQQKKRHADAPLVQKALDAVIAFVREPTSIRLIAQPATPVKLAQVGELGQARPNDILTLLGITVDRPQ